MADSKREMPILRRPGAVLVAILLLIAPAFYIFTYNTGYGYDALEYLVIGRALLHGVRISTFILSKGWATYVMTAAALAVIPSPDHAWIALVITILFVLGMLATWWAGYRLFGPAVAGLAALLTAACAFFMEMNFLEPEIPVYVSGLLAAYTLEIARPKRPAIRWLAAGLWVGVGFAFKSVALFYLAGIFAYLLFSHKHLGLRERLRSAGLVTLGFGCVAAVPAAYFAATGQLSHHIQWSFLFPLLHYPSNTFALRNLYTKLLWFFVLLFAAALLASAPPRPPPGFR